MIAHSAGRPVVLVFVHESRVDPVLEAPAPLRMRTQSAIGRNGSTVARIDQGQERTLWAPPLQGRPSQEGPDSPTGRGPVAPRKHPPSAGSYPAWLPNLRPQTPRRSQRFATCPESGESRGRPRQPEIGQRILSRRRGCPDRRRLAALLLIVEHEVVACDALTREFNFSSTFRWESSRKARARVRGGMPAKDFDVPLSMMQNSIGPRWPIIRSTNFGRQRVSSTPPPPHPRQLCVEDGRDVRLPLLELRLQPFQKRLHRLDRQANLAV